MWQLVGLVVVWWMVRWWACLAVPSHSYACIKKTPRRNNRSVKSVESVERGVTSLTSQPELKDLPETHRVPMAEPL